MIDRLLGEGQRVAREYACPTCGTTTIDESSGPCPECGDKMQPVGEEPIAVDEHNALRERVTQTVAEHPKWDSYVIARVLDADEAQVAAILRDAA